MLTSQKNPATSEVGLSGVGYWLQDSGLTKHEIIFFILQVGHRIGISPVFFFFFLSSYTLGVWQQRAIPVCCAASLVHLWLVFVWAGAVTNTILLPSLGCCTLPVSFQFSRVGLETHSLHLRINNHISCV